jgi:hypothetical protein
MMITQEQLEQLHAGETIVLSNYGESYRAGERFEIQCLVLEVVSGVPGMNARRACQRVVVKLVGGIGQ